MTDEASLGASPSPSVVTGGGPSAANAVITIRLRCPGVQHPIDLAVQLSATMAQLEAVTIEAIARAYESNLSQPPRAAPTACRFVARGKQLSVHGTIAQNGITDRDCVHVMLVNPSAAGGGGSTAAASSSSRSARNGDPPAADGVPHRTVVGGTPSGGSDPSMAPRPLQGAAAATARAAMAHGAPRHAADTAAVPPQRPTPARPPDREREGPLDQIGTLVEREFRNGVRQELGHLREHLIARGVVTEWTEDPSVTSRSVAAAMIEETAESPTTTTTTNADDAEADAREILMLPAPRVIRLTDGADDNGDEMPAAARATYADRTGYVTDAMMADFRSTVFERRFWSTMAWPGDGVTIAIGLLLGALCIPWAWGSPTLALAASSPRRKQLLGIGIALNFMAAIYVGITYPTLMTI